MSRTSPAVAGWELMLRIRQQATRRGTKSKDITAALDISQQYWLLVTKSKGVLSQDKLERLIDLLEIDDDERTELLALREIAKGRSKFSEFSGLISDELMRYYDLEDGALGLRSVDKEVIPGLLQTEDYIRALMSSIVSTGRPIEAEQRVRIRLLRQHRLDGPDPLHLTAIIGEGALMQLVGGEDVQREQLQHLQDLIEKYPDNLDVRVLPFKASGSSAALNTSTFHVLEFDSPRLPNLGWTETAIYTFIEDAPAKVEALDYLYNRVQTVALNRDASSQLISQIARGIG